MAFDGIVTAALVCELKETLTGGHISKIAQPEKDELLLTIKAGGAAYRLLISSSASLPLIYLTRDNKPSPMTAPNFCMLLRKHLNSAKIISITQPGLERVIRMEIEHLNEFGDLCTKFLIAEIMGKHSNIIFCDDQNKILDSIKHISFLVSSVREVLPGREYFIPRTQDKREPLSLDYEAFASFILKKPEPLSQALYKGLTGFSPLMAEELCFRASLDSAQAANTLEENEGLHLYKNLERLTDNIRSSQFFPNIVYEEGEPLEYSAVPLSCYSGDLCREYASMSELLEDYYSVKSMVTRIRQKSADLRKIIANALDKSRRKYDLQKKQLADTNKRDKYKVYGELLHTYGYELMEGASSLQCLDYYTGEEAKVPLDPNLTAAENAKKYFDRYNKLKRTFEAVSSQILETESEITHLESISASLDIAQKEEDLTELKEELIQSGYMKRKALKGKKAPKAIAGKPFHYLSSDGFDIYVGKNNFQNDALTFKFADGGDWWFHAKGIAGSHVILKNSGRELPDRAFAEAGSLAAYYSKAREAEKVEIDYTEKKNVKKPGGGKPGFVVYYTNYSLMAVPDIHALEIV